MKAEQSISTVGKRRHVVEHIADTDEGKKGLL